MDLQEVGYHGKSGLRQGTLGQEAAVWRTGQSHFATLPIHVAPSLCAVLHTVVSLGPPEGATTHHFYLVWVFQA